GVRDRDDALAVTRDSRLRTFGVLAIGASVLLRSAAGADGLGVEAGRPSVSVETAVVRSGDKLGRARSDPRRDCSRCGECRSARLGDAGAAMNRRLYRNVLRAFQQIGEVVMLLTAAAR